MEMGAMIRQESKMSKYDFKEILLSLLKDKDVQEAIVDIMKRNNVDRFSAAFDCISANGFHSGGFAD